MRRNGKSTLDAWLLFRDAFKKDKHAEQLVLEDIIAEPHVPILDKWVRAVNNHDIHALMKLYAEDVIMIPAFSTRIRRNKDQVNDLFRDLFEKNELQVIPFQVSSQQVDGLKVDIGQYKMKWKSQGFEESNDLRFSFVIKEGKIASHHSSLEPGENVSISHPEAYDADYLL